MENDDFWVSMNKILAPRLGLTRSGRGCAGAWGRHPFPRNACAEIQLEPKLELGTRKMKLRTWQLGTGNCELEWELEHQQTKNAMGYLSLFVSVFRLLISKFCDKTYATKPFLTITSAQVRFGCICSSCCKLQLFNFATKPFHVTRSAKRLRHNHPIETAIHS